MSGKRRVAVKRSGRQLENPNLSLPFGADLANECRGLRYGPDDSEQRPSEFSWTHCFRCFQFDYERSGALM